MSLQNLPNVGLTSASVIGRSRNLAGASAATSVQNWTVDRDRLTTAIPDGSGRDQRPFGDREFDREVALKRFQSPWASTALYARSASRRGEGGDNRAVGAAKCM